MTFALLDGTAYCTLADVTWSSADKSGQLSLSTSLAVLNPLIGGLICSSVYVCLSVHMEF